MQMRQKRKYLHWQAEMYMLGQEHSRKQWPAVPQICWKQNSNTDQIDAFIVSYSILPFCLSTDRSFWTNCIHSSIFPLCIQSNMSPPLTEHTGIGCIMLVHCAQRRPAECVCVCVCVSPPPAENCRGGKNKNQLLGRSATTSCCKVRREIIFRCKVTGSFRCAKLIEADHALSTWLAAEGHVTGDVSGVGETRGLYK